MGLVGLFYVINLWTNEGATWVATSFTPLESQPTSRLLIAIGINLGGELSRGFDCPDRQRQHIAILRANNSPTYINTPKRYL